MKKVLWVRFGFCEEIEILGTVLSSSVTAAAPYRRHLIESAAQYLFQRRTVPPSSAHHDHRSVLLTSKVAGLQLKHKYMAEQHFLRTIRRSKASGIRTGFARPAASITRSRRARTYARTSRGCKPGSRGRRVAVRTAWKGRKRRTRCVMHWSRAQLIGPRVSLRAHLPIFGGAAATCVLNDFGQLAPPSSSMAVRRRRRGGVRNRWCPCLV
jgi:hypothetical protein